MKKVLIVITTAFVEYGGLTTVVMNYLRFMDKKGLKIDVASTNSAPQKLADEIKVMGGKYYSLGKRKKIPAYCNNLKKLLKEQNYDVVHVHGNSATMSLELAIAKACKIPVRIAHVHNSRSNYPTLNRILSPVFKGLYTDAIAVSKLSGDWLYGQNQYTIFNNAIDLNKYCFNASVREELKKTWKLTGKRVIGTVGKLNPQKNQTFLLDIFSEIAKQTDDTVLMIVGGGALEKELKEKAVSLGISERVIFTGMRNDANRLIQVFDYFVFPSIFEGLGMVLIESQASGLPCFASDQIPRETKLTSLISYTSLQESPKKWAEKILQYDVTRDRQNISQQACESIRKKGYDISCESGKLLQMYQK